MRAGRLLPAVFLGLASQLTAQGQDDRPDRAVKDPELQSKINGAIFAGIDYLSVWQNKNGSWTYDRQMGRGGMGRDFTQDGSGGLTALALYALAASGVRASDPTIQKGIAWCEEHDRPFSSQGRFGTYSAALLILALTRIDAKKHRRWIHRLASRVNGAQLVNGQWTYYLYNMKGTATKSSPRGPRWMTPDAMRQQMLRGGDNSNTQFAVLGLWAAQAIAGFRVPRRTWNKIARFFKRTQTQSGEWTYRDPTETVAAPRNGARDRGGRGAPQGRVGAGMTRPRMTMTAAGLCSYVYAYAALRGAVKGLAAARKTKTAGTGLRAFIEKRAQWDFTNYYLVYSIERVGTVLGVPEVAWYPSGAKKLVASQRVDGSWGARDRAGFGGGNHGDSQNVYETSLALLFLSKATAYPLTGVKRSGQR